MKHTRIFHCRTPSSPWLALVAGMVLLVSGSALSQNPGKEAPSEQTERQARTNGDVVAIVGTKLIEGTGGLPVAGLRPLSIADT